MMKEKETSMSTIKDIMTPNPTTCQEQDTVCDVVQVMKSQDTGVVPIVNQNDKPCGIVTDRDICLEIGLGQLDPLSTPVSEIMQTDLLTCAPQDEVAQVVEQMKSKQVKRILVVESDQVVGIVSEVDIVRSEGRQKAGELASGIYQ
jgi:CBS domain-containing protein